MKHTSILGLLTLLLFSGCREERVVVVDFEPNRVFAYNMGQRAEQPMEQASQQTTEVLGLLFGTPNDPQLPDFIVEDEELAALLNMEHLKQASGPSEEAGRGLYRKHCAICHGITGNGRGTTAALLDPYPRDYRMGRFKFKSTAIGTKPTKQDIAYLIKHGIQGTSMVKIPELGDAEIDALTDYVIYLSWRGEVERSLLMESEELDFSDGESLYDPKLKETDPDEFEYQWEFIQDTTVDVAEKWLAAPERVKAVPARDSSLVPDTVADVLAAMSAIGDSPVKASVARGRELFVSEKTACSKCHGLEGRGDGQTNDYDEWTKDWTKKFNLEPEDEYNQVPLIARGALPVRKVAPRNFQEGVFRAGAEPEQIYQRIALGIEGSPMPAAAVESAEIWDLVNFVRSLVVPRDEDATPGKG